MLNIIFWVAAMVSPQPQFLTDLPLNREGLPARRIEVVTVKTEDDEDLPSANKDLQKKKHFSRKVVKARSFNRTGIRQSPFV